MAMAPSRPAPRRRRRASDQVAWKRVGLRRTPQREVVLDLVVACREHPTAEWIWREARKSIPDISLATVYRTLRVLKEKGLIWEFTGGANPSRFDGTHGAQEHLRCVSCGQVVDLDLPEVKGVRGPVEARTAWALDPWPLVLYGLCPSCVARVGPAVPNGGHEPPATDASERGSGPQDDRDLAEGYW
jgi:Fe2+ or Zn2+ uptake regulation protein